MLLINNYLTLGAVLFGLGLVGIILNRNNIIALLMCIELILLAVNTNFIAFSHHYNAITGQVFVFFILTVAAAEAAIGLAIVVLIYRERGNIDVNAINQLKG
ncbi:MAG: NADH-quinone oxidoreductase subunit K [Legionellales bacterium RIFCSPHIGHO2_12_FULL_42_9]|nr:MAG: NADH-quinone oxidoreductase subunit K [Legionellales bacterium RIFCSPHIGHO2_12_FULL_42_9]